MSSKIRHLNIPVIIEEQAKKIQAFEIELMERNIEVEMLKRDLKLLRIANGLSKVVMTQTIIEP